MAGPVRTIWGPGVSRVLLAKSLLQTPLLNVQSDLQRSCTSNVRKENRFNLLDRIGIGYLFLRWLEQPLSQVLA